MSTCQCRCSETREVSGCIKCELNFKCDNESHIHFNQVHVCKYDLCGVKFREESELKDHIGGHHGSSLEPPVEEDNDNHEKEVGDKEVKDDNSTQQINSAIDSSDAKESVSSCNLCDKTFFDENELEWHIRKQHSKKSESVYSCNLCDMIFAGEGDLELIIRKQLDWHIRKQHTYW